MMPQVKVRYSDVNHAFPCGSREGGVHDGPAAYHNGFKEGRGMMPRELCATQIWIGYPIASCAASIKASVNVGWA